MQIKLHTPVLRSTISTRTLWLGAVGLIMALATFALVYRLDVNPRPWYDEGMYTSLAHTLLRDGAYALPDSQGPRLFDPIVQTGPTLILPLALVLYLFGPGFLQARLLVVAFSLLALVAYLLLGRRLVGPGAALLALFFLVLGNARFDVSFVFLGRQVLGETLALGLLALGSWAWLGATADPARANRWLALAGVLIGLSIVTKAQLLIAFGVAWAGLFLLNRFYYRQVGWRAFLLPGGLAVGCYGLWYGLQWLVSGPQAFGVNARLLSEGASLHGFSFNLPNVKEALDTLWKIRFLFWGVPGLLYGLYLARQRDKNGLAQAFVLLLTIFWLGWYIGLSIGWNRYVFIGVALTYFWTARLLVDLANGSLLPRWLVEPLARQVLAGLFILALTWYNGRGLLSQVFLPGEDQVGPFAAFLNEQVPAQAQVLSWEWELDMLAPHRFHYPPTPFIYRNIDNSYRARTGTKLQYDPGPRKLDYVIDGPYSRERGVFADYIRLHTDKVATVGQYTLYKVVR